MLLVQKDKMDIDIEMAKAIYELEKIKGVHRVKIEIEFINGTHISQENTKPNKINRVTV